MQTNTWLNAFLTDLLYLVIVAVSKWSVLLMSPNSCSDYHPASSFFRQIITALEEDPTAQKMQLGYRLQQIAAAVENKVTDL